MNFFMMKQGWTGGLTGVEARTGLSGGKADGQWGVVADGCNHVFGCGGRVR